MSHPEASKKVITLKSLALLGRNNVGGILLLWAGIPPLDNTSPTSGFQTSPWDRHGEIKRQLGNIVHGAFQPLLAKHSKGFSLVDAVSVGVDRMQRNFEPMRKQVEAWQKSELTDVTARIIIYQAFIKCEAIKNVELARQGPVIRGFRYFQLHISV